MKKNSLFKNIYVSTLILKFLYTGLHFFAIILIARIFGPELQGTYAYFFNLATILSLFLNLGIYQSYPNFKKSSEQEGDSFKEKIEGKYLSLFLIQYFFYLIVGLIAGLFIGTYLSVLIGLLVPTIVFYTQINILIIIKDLIFRNILNVCTEALFIILLILASFTKTLSIEIIFLAYLIQLFIGVLVIFLKLKKYFHFKKINHKFIKKVLKFGFLPMITALLITLNYRIDIFILESLVPIEEVGLYSVAIMLSQVAWVVSDAFREIILSKVLKENIIETVMFSLKINLFLTAFEFLFILIFGKQVLLLLFGIEYLDSYNSLVIVFIGVISMIFFKLLGPIYLLEGKTRFYFYSLLISTITNVILNYIFIPIWGIEGAAVATVLSYSLCGMLFFLNFTKKYNISLLEVVSLSEDEKVILGKSVNRVLRRSNK